MCSCCFKLNTASFRSSGSKRLSVGQGHEAVGQSLDMGLQGQAERLKSFSKSETWMIWMFGSATGLEGDLGPAGAVE